MDLEQQLRSTYAERLGELDVPGGDLAGARRTGARMRVRRRAAAGIAAVAVVAVATGGALLGTGRVGIGPSGGAGQWRELPAPPLSPRADALSVWTGNELVVVGGDRQPCPPTADCAVPSHLARDGAAYDPGTNSWHRIADAPVPLGPGDRMVSAGGSIIVRSVFPHGLPQYYEYDPDGDSWTRIGRPGPVGRDRDLPSALGSRVYVMAGRRVQEFDISRGTWRRLPPDTLRPRLAQPRVTATDAGPVISGYDATQPNDGRTPSVVLADVFDGTSWHRLPPTGQLDNLWTWNGVRMVDPDPTVVDGGETDPFPHPYPAGGLLDPATGAWSPLPKAVSVDPGEGWGGVDAAGPRWFALYGQVYDSQTGSVVGLTRPDGAPMSSSSGAWADGRLIVFGGVTFGAGGPTLTNRAWLWTP